MLKQAIWKVLSKRVVSNSGDKLLLPCLYLPTTSFHAGQVMMLSPMLNIKVHFMMYVHLDFHLAHKKGCRSKPSCWH
ncbi:hypothetical protein V6Z11_D09G014400 [Gossypium hirsutum]